MITLYSKEGCSACDKARLLLKKLKAKFRERRVDRSQKAFVASLDASGTFSVPVLDIGGKVIAGYREKEIKRAVQYLNGKNLR